MPDVIDLDDDEKKVMEIFGKLAISQNVNVDFHTIRKKLPPKYHVNLKEIIKRLIATKGLIRLYRAPDNYCLTDEGFRIAHYLWKKRQEKEYGFRIVKRG